MSLLNELLGMPPAAAPKGPPMLTGVKPKAPLMSPATQPNPNDFDLATKAQGYVKPGPMSPVEAPAGTDWKGVADGVLKGLSMAQGGGEEEPPKVQAEAFRGGGYFTPPSATQFTDLRIGNKNTSGGILNGSR